ncbi:MAG: lipoate--protein ligase family protein [Verrucomicrobiae bacterium]|nr:lipoate--protein ligase family protein [Verrucomicrobiae bacterium]
MQLLDLTLRTPEQNLACDEALFNLCEEGGSHEVLRFWEPRDYFVVLGYSNKRATEANENSCRADGVPILRRCTGGGTVLQGPGCLNYTLVLRIGSRPELENVTSTNCFIMEQNRAALQPLVGEKIEIEGFTDLAIAGRKFSGNAQRRGKQFILFHGSFLLDFDLAKIERYLSTPSRQPAYRSNRSHEDFLMNLPFAAKEARGLLMEAWQTTNIVRDVPMSSVQRLSEQKYARVEWNLKF